MGFCFFNNVAAAALAALQQPGRGREGGREGEGAGGQGVHAWQKVQ